jgi:hypothetical protein
MTQFLSFDQIVLSLTILIFRTISPRYGINFPSNTTTHNNCNTNNHQQNHKFFLFQILPVVKVIVTEYSEEEHHEGSLPSLLACSLLLSPENVLSPVLVLAPSDMESQPTTSAKEVMVTTSNASTMGVVFILIKGATSSGESYLEGSMGSNKQEGNSGLERRWP